MPRPDTTTYLGYRPDFLGTDHSIPLPVVSAELSKHTARLRADGSPLLHYQHYTIRQHALRRLPIYSAANIDGESFRSIPRREVSGGSDSWYKDKRISYRHQWGNELYRADHSDFDKGHLTKREDVQWGEHDTAVAGARSTFFYTNAAPQHADLNRAVWKQLEDYILREESVVRGLRICVMSGPVLSEHDPVFVTEVRGDAVQLPTLFWKVLYYLHPSGEPRRLAFLMGQAHLLREHEIAQFPRTTPSVDFFANFEEASTYQVKVDTVETLTGLSFAPASEPFTDKRSIPLILEEVRGRGGATRRVIENLHV